jgi:transcriptional regulator with XRE-family HTH domain
MPYQPSVKVPPYGGVIGDAPSALAGLVGALSVGERLWLWRRRHGYDRRAAAAVLGLPRRALKDLETGKGGAGAALPGYVTRLRSTPPEALRVARRRSGLTSGAVAARLGISRMALWKWERAADPRLTALWEGQSDGR